MINKSLAIKLLKLSLFIVFLWFGILKLLNVSPVLDIVAGAYPFIANTPWFFTALALFEIILGIGILIPRFMKISAWIMIFHLLFATLGVLVSPQAFIGGFPYLSMVGEFVVKNFVLVAGALVVARHDF